ncbi:MAG: glutamine--tRNA ligase, partial [Candidatus Bipolaricaulota bacterium]|nr:glutamine--tRNA ligase [Candidatus Bipolaricaulota bacterium]
KATLHWVSARHAIGAEARLYEQLFTRRNPLEVEEGKDWLEGLNPDSLRILTDCKLEGSLADAGPGDRFQFERVGYFCVDSDSKPGAPVFNRTATLRDTWARIRKRQRKEARLQ